MKRLLLLAAAVAIVAAPAWAFHDDGVAHCNGCHTMHNSQNGQPMAAIGDGAGGTTPAGSPGLGVQDQLLLFVNKTDVCLRCHYGYNSYHVWSENGPLDPGQEHGAGNFVFLEEDNLNDGHSGGAVDANGDLVNPIPGYSGGHTVLSGIVGNDPEGELSTAPGGGFLTSDLGCSSCHDPHGNQGYRLTYVSGQTSAAGTWTSTIDASAIGLFGPGAVEGNTNHPAYRSGYSEWCGQCHGAFHNNSGNRIHPSGELMTSITVEQYNRYRGTLDCINVPPAGGNPCGSGTANDAYLALVPFEDPNNDVVTRAQGAIDGSSRVSCVSCHRSHATSAPDAGRWDFNVTGLAEDGVESGSYAIPQPYGAEQRSLCNKCHGKDEFDTPIAF